MILEAPARARFSAVTARTNPIVPPAAVAPLKPELAAIASTASPRVRRKRRPFLVFACWTYLLAVIGLCVFMRLQGDRISQATLLLFAPRWPYAVPILLLLPWAMLARRWRLALVALAGFAVVLCPIMGFRVALPSAAIERGDLRLLTFNVHRQHVDVPGFASYIAQTQPDVIAIQDWSAALQKKLFSDPQWHTHRVGELFVASRFPIGKVTPLDFQDSVGISKAERGAAAVFEIKTPRGSVSIINLHLASPHTALNSLVDDGGAELNRNARRRWSESEAVRTLADSISGPTVVTGDFNTTDDSPIFREHWSGFTDAFLARGFGLGWTYLNDHTQFRIDHVLADESWQTLNAWVGPKAGSPHRPLVTDLRLR